MIKIRRDVKNIEMETYSSCVCDRCGKIIWEVSIESDEPVMDITTNEVFKLKTSELMTGLDGKRETEKYFCSVECIHHELMNVLNYLTHLPKSIKESIPHEPKFSVEKFVPIMAHNPCCEMGMPKYIPLIKESKE